MAATVPFSPHQQTWFRWLPASIIAHIVLFASIFRGLPDAKSWQDEVLQRPPLHVTVQSETALFWESEAIAEVADGVPESLDPFAEPSPALPEPVTMHLEKPHPEANHVEITGTSPVPHSLPKQSHTEADAHETETDTKEHNSEAQERNSEAQERNSEAQERNSDTQEANPDAQEATSEKAKSPHEEIPPAPIGTNTVDKPSGLANSRSSDGEAMGPSNHAKSGVTGGTGTKPATTPPDVWANYVKQLYTHFQKTQYYPAIARQRRIMGAVTIVAEIERDGTIISAKVQKSSGFAILDDAAVQSALRASPVPAFPTQAVESRRTVTIPYQFRVR